MAKPITSLVLIISCSFIATHAREHEKSWFENICQGKEKVARVHFYVQDVLAGPNPTVYEVARSSISSNSPTTFGQVLAVDNLLTAEPDINSEQVGRFQGLITSADLETTALMMNFNLVFTSGRYNGSTISILGRIQLRNKQRELPVAGGTGVFRLARGYALTSTYSHDVEAEYAVIEYTLYVTYVDDDDSSKSIQGG